MKKLILAAGCLLLLSSASFAVDWGTISGRIVLDEKAAPEPALLFKKGAAEKDPAVCSAADVFKEDLVVNKDNLGVANIFVYLYKAPKDIHPDEKFDPKVDSKKNPKIVYFDQKDCIYKPRALFVQAGQTVQVLNADPVVHNTQTSSFKNPQYNFTIGAGSREGDGVDYALPSDERTPFEVKCSFHTHMFAYWLVKDHPYAAVTDKDGKFTIKNLPVGEHEFRVWHERPGYLSRKYAVEVKKGDQELPELKFKLAEFSDD